MERNTYSPFRDFGYMQWTDAVHNMKKLSGNEIQVLYHLAMHDLQNDQCIASHEQISEWTGLGHKTVRRRLDDLKAYGLVSWKSGGRTIGEFVDRKTGEAKEGMIKEANVYQFTMTEDLSGLLQEREVMAKIENHQESCNGQNDHFRIRNGQSDLPITHTEKSSRENEEEERSSSSSLSSDNNIGEGVLVGQNDRFKNGPQEESPDDIVGYDYNGKPLTELGPDDVVGEEYSGKPIYRWQKEEEEAERKRIRERPKKSLADLVLESLLDSPAHEHFMALGNEHGFSDSEVEDAFASLVTEYTTDDHKDRFRITFSKPLMREFLEKDFLERIGSREMAMTA